MDDILMSTCPTKGILIGGLTADQFLAMQYRMERVEVPERMCFIFRRIEQLILMEKTNDRQ